MSLVRNIAFMGSSTAMRLGFGLLTFIVMARLLGPERFGVVMLWLSVATIATLAANFGFTPYLLRQIGVEPENAKVVMSEVLTAKLLLSTAVILLSLAGLFWVSDGSRLVFIALLVALLADSMTEFLNVGFRATNRFAAEARLASVASALQFAVVAGLTWLDPRAESAAIAFMLSRLVVTAITWRAQRQYFTGLRCSSLAAGIRRIRDAVAFATDFGLQSLFGQIDSVVLNHFAGSATVGVYQAGMRLFNGGAQAAGILANVFIPRAAGAAKDSVKLNLEATRIQWAFVTFGLGFGLFLAFSADIVVKVLFGPAFSDLTLLLPWMGALFFVRFVAASWGVILTSAGEQVFRAVVNLTQWFVVLASAAHSVPKWGAVGWIGCLLLGNTIIAVAYYIKGIRISGFSWMQLAFSLGAVAAFVWLLPWPAAATST